MFLLVNLIVNLAIYGDSPVCYIYSCEIVHGSFTHIPVSCTTTFGRGEEPVLRKRIKQYMRKQLIQTEPSPPWDLINQVEGNPYGLDYLCVLDFEATCEEVNPPDYIHEIIEFPVLLLNLKTLEIVSVYGEGVIT